MFTMICLAIYLANIITSRDVIRKQTNLGGIQFKMCDYTSMDKNVHQEVLYGKRRAIYMVWFDWPFFC